MSSPRPKPHRTVVKAALHVVLLALTLLAAPSVALGHVGRHRPEIEGMARPDAPPAGPRGRAELTVTEPLRVDGADGRFSATFTVENRGDGPLRMYRVGPLVDDVAPSFPPGVRVHAPDLETKTIPPGGRRVYTVEWTPGETLARQGSGIVVLESDSAAPGAADFDPPLRVAVELDRRPGWLRAMPAFSVGLPLLLVAFSLLSFRLRRIGDRAVLHVASVITALGFGADLVLLATMNRTLGRADGSFGLQHVERRLVAGLDFFLGLDGLNAPLLLGLGAVSTAGVASLPAGPTPRLRVLAGLGVAFSAGKLFVLSQSLALSTLALAVSAAGAAFVLASVARFEPSRRGPLASIGLALGLGVGSFAAFGHLVTQHARAEHPELGALASSVTDLARIALHAHGDGPPRLALGLVIASAIALLGLAPAHTWTERVVHPVVAPIAGLLPTLGAIALLRGSVTLFPTERALVASTLEIVGVASLALAAAGLLGRRTFGRIAAAAALASGGLAALAFSSLTLQGMEAAVVLLAVRALALPLVARLGASLEERSGEPSLAAHGGLLAAAPRWSLAWVFAVASAAALPGGAATGALLLGAIGPVGRAPVQGGLLAAAVAGLTALFGSTLAIVRGPRPAWWSKSLRLEAQGGRPSDLRGAELFAALVLVSALVLALAFPRFWFGSTARTLLDLFRALEAPGPTQVS